MATIAIQKRRVFASVYEASWKTDRFIRFHRPRFCVCACEPTVSAGEETRKYRYCDFCDDQGNWSQAVKSAASREPAEKINAAKPPRKSWLAVIFMTVGMPMHSEH